MMTLSLSTVGVVMCSRVLNNSLESGDEVVKARCVGETRNVLVTAVVKDDEWYVGDTFGWVILVVATPTERKDCDMLN